jgi:DNA-binding transcriptional regulator YhcF (GntR family)
MGKRTRSKTRQKDIIHAIRDMILTGEIKPGERLPNRLWFEKHFDASSVTIQAAFAALTQAGFIVSLGRNGTYVSQRPPHLFNYGLVFATAPGQNDWSNFHKSLLSETEAIKVHYQKSITCYFNIGEKLNTDNLSRLLKDVSEKQLAGLILISRACFRGTPLLELTDIPRVVLKGQAFDPNIPVITFGGDRGFAKPAIEHLRSLGRKRLAFVLATGMDPVRELEIQEVLTEYELPFFPYSVQCVHPTESRWAANLACLFAKLPLGVRPDGVVIAVVNLVV